VGKRIVLATFGSLGDLHPFLALGAGLLARGAEPVIATHEYYRRKVEALGLGFAPLRRDYDPTHADLNALSMDPWRGTEVILREFLLPHIRETYEDLAQAVEGADLLASHSIIFPAPLLVEKTGIPWASIALSPLAYMSAIDPSHTGPLPWLNRIWQIHPGLNRRLIGMIRGVTDRWCEPLRALRKDLGLSAGGHPFFEGQHSPSLGLALFSETIGAPQEDWPKTVKQTGFCFLDDARQMPADLRRFLDDGPAPVVFTLGSAAVLTAGDFFVECERAARELGQRAVFIAGKETRIKASRDVFVAEYAPYSQVFARAAAIVHQGGIGTTGQGLRAGRQALVVPFAHDQPDNAYRVERLGAGLSIPRPRFTAERAVAKLRPLLEDPVYFAQAQTAAMRIGMENGVDTACRALLEQI
jgi:UDP:flavonoid glycosyltransferase YjiC (YdhE family)